MRRALGKGLSQLYSEHKESTSEKKTSSLKRSPKSKEIKRTKKISPSKQVTPATQLPIESIRPNSRQPRKHFDEESLKDLTNSIRGVGVLQPLIVREIGGGAYELIAGERRLRAAQKAGLRQVPVVIRGADSQNLLEIALIENIQREDISPLESAMGFKHLIEEFGLSQEQVAAKVGKSRVAVTNTLRLLRLPEEVLQALQAGDLSEGHAKAILMVDSPARQVMLAREVISKGLSVRETESAARRLSGKEEPNAKSTRVEPKLPGQRSNNPYWAQLEDGLSVYFGAPVRFKKAEVGGKLLIEFYSDEDLQRILDVLGVHL